METSQKNRPLSDLTKNELLEEIRTQNDIITYLTLVGACMYNRKSKKQTLQFIENHIITPAKEPIKDSVNLIFNRLKQDAKGLKEIERMELSAKSK